MLGTEMWFQQEIVPPTWQLKFDKAILTRVSKTIRISRLVFYSPGKKLANHLSPLCHQIRSEIKTHRESFAHDFPRFSSTTCDCFEFWLVHLIVCVTCDWTGVRHVFPRLRAGYMNLLWVLIGSQDCLCNLWLARVITGVFGFTTLT